MKVLRSSHQNLGIHVSGTHPPEKEAAVKVVPLLFRIHLPLGLGIPRHGIPQEIDLLPAFPPLVSVSLLRAHVGDLELVTPSFGIAFLVLYTVSLYRPFSWTFPLHDTPSFIGTQDKHEFAASAEMGIASNSRE